MRFATPMIRSFAATACLLMTCTVAHAEKLHFTATLSAADEVPPKDSKGMGHLTATLDTDSHMFMYTVTYKDMTGPVTAAHFHGPAAPGANAGPVVPVKGSLTSPIKGSATLTPDQEKDLEGGMWYFNLHTSANPGGEIRGQVMKK